MSCICNKNFPKVHNYKFYHTMHPDGTVYRSSGILIKTKMNPLESNAYCTSEIRGTSIVVFNHVRQLVITSVYHLPKHKIKSDQYEVFFKTLDNRFIAGGGSNAKHTQWESRFISPKERQLLLPTQITQSSLMSPQM